MDEKNEIEFFKILANQEVQLPVLETGIITETGIGTVVFTDETGMVKSKHFKNLMIEGYLTKVLEETEVKCRVLGMHNPKLVMFSKQGKKKLYTESEIRELITKKKTPISANLAQKLSSLLFVEEKFITAKVLYIRKEFLISFSVENLQENDPILTSHMLDLINLIVSALETSELKRVIHLELDFIKDNSSAIWLSGCIKCVLVEPCYLLKNPLNTEEDVVKLKKFVPKAAPKRTPSRFLIKKVGSKEASEFSKLYVFKKGQLRNLESRLNSPIKYTTEDPENFRTGSLPEIHINKLLPDLAPPRFLHHSESEGLNLPVNTINKHHLFNFENTTKEIMDTSKSFTKEEIRANARKKLTEMPKKLSFMSHARKNTSVKTPTSMKSLPKLKKAPEYGSYFMELVLNTYCKKNEQIKQKKAEFGLGTFVTIEEFSSLINVLEDYPGSKTSRLATNSALDYYPYSKCSTPSIDDAKVPVNPIRGLKFIKKASKKLAKNPGRLKKNPVLPNTLHPIPTPKSLK